MAELSDLDIERSASVLIDSRGYDGAVLHAAAMVVAMTQLTTMKAEWSGAV